MAGKQELIDDLRKNYGNMLNLTQATAALGYKDREATKKFLAGVPAFDLGKEKKYMAKDIGRRLFDRMISSQQ